MRYGLLFILFLSSHLIPESAVSQQKAIDSLRLADRIGKNDIQHVNDLNKLGYLLQSVNPSEADSLHHRALTLAEKLRFKKGIAEAYGNLGNIKSNQGKYDDAMELYERSMKIRTEIGDKRGIAGSNLSFGNILFKKGQLQQAMERFRTAVEYYKELNDTENLPVAYNNLGLTYRVLGDHPKAMSLYVQALALAREMNNKRGEASALNNIGVIYQKMMNDSLAMEYYQQALALRMELGDKKGMLSCYTNLGEIHSGRGQKDTALEYYQQAYDLAVELADRKNSAMILANMGVITMSKKEYPLAEQRFREALDLQRKLNDQRAIAHSLINLGVLNSDMGNYQEAHRFIGEGLSLGRTLKANETIKDGLYALSRLHLRENNIEEAYKAHVELSQVKDSLFNIEKTKQIAEMREKFDAESREKAILLLNKESEIRELELQRKEEALMRQTLETEKVQRERELKVLELAKKETELRQQHLEVESRGRKIELLNKDKLLQEAELDNERFFRNASIAGLVAILIITALLYNRYLFRKRLTAQLQDALDTVQKAQQQLIQSEKMASLGQLTAGIAHEIQNPLNFVNNFSELMSEISDEALAEILGDPNRTDMEKLSEIRSVLEEIKANSEKVTYHGKRAGDIIRQMLMHSRNTGMKYSKEDVNKVLQEIITLAYHGRHAQMEDFSVTIKKEFASDLPPAQIMIQDFSRVIVNLLNNAFDAVQDKRTKNLNGYAPAITIKTQRASKHLEIRIRDNGIGIPSDVMDRIFQPFFTTKPTGQGTGLGLSLAYEIITKGHHGSIRVESEVGMFTEFVVSLPTADGV